MRTFKWISVLSIIITVLMPMKANAEEELPPMRMASKNICVQKATPTNSGWKIGAAIRSWNSMDLVNLFQKPVCPVGIPTITISEVPTIVFGDKVVSGLTEWENANPTWALAPDNVWTFDKVNISLGYDTIISYKRPARKCVGWYVSAHEIGHALGLSHNDMTDSVMSYSFDIYANCMIMQPKDSELLASLGY